MLIDFSKLHRLPSIPLVAVRLLEKFSDPDVNVSEITEIIQADPAITARILRAASSIQFGAGRPVTDLHRGVHMLGRKNVTSLALCFSLSDDSMRRGPFAELYKSVWLRSVLQGTVARLLCRRLRDGNEGEYFTAGLLSEIGALAMLKSSPQEYAAMIDERNPPAQAPIEQGSATADPFDELSASLLEHWKLAAQFVVAVRDRSLSLEQLDALPKGESRRLTHVVAFASAVSRYFLNSEKALALMRTLEIWSTLLGFPEEDIDEMFEAIQSAMVASADLFDAEVSGLGSSAEIMSDAMEQMARLATSAPADSDRNHLLDENGQLKRRVRDLLHRSAVDALTQVFNRAYFDQVLAERVAVARLSGRSLGLLFIDVDYFKSINDIHGHTVGDDVLRHIARTLAGVVRGNDVLARYGGEEFVVLPAEPNAQGLQSLAERLRAAVAELAIPDDGGVLKATISVGGAVLDPPHDDQAARRLVNLADASLYAAKEGGRNRVEIREVPVLEER